MKQFEAAMMAFVSKVKQAKLGQALIDNTVSYHVVLVRVEFN